jgi:hypothetical protein
MEESLLGAVLDSVSGDRALVCDLEGSVFLLREADSRARGSQKKRPCDPLENGKEMMVRKRDPVPLLALIMQLLGLQSDLLPHSAGGSCFVDFTCHQLVHHTIMHPSLPSLVRAKKERRGHRSDGERGRPSRIQFSWG